jgi:membrane protein YqaA with SNARE-associated domain
MGMIYLSKPHKKAPAIIIAAVAVAICIVLVAIAVTLPRISKNVWRDMGYLGIFLLSLIGAGSVIIPVPYTVILLAISPAFDPILLAIAAGIGAAVGEMVGYGIGFTGRIVIGKKRRRQMDAMLRIFERFGLPAIFVFALTPLPDDLLFIPLGLMRYSLKKALLACAAGKFLMSLIIAYAGKGTVGLFGEDWLLAGSVAILLALIIIVMFRIDWVKIAENYAPPKRIRSEIGKLRSLNENRSENAGV